jgi:hypothetical protein
MPRGTQIGQIDIGWCHVECIVAGRDGEWKDAYRVDPAAERARRTDKALAFLRAKGSKVS